MTAFEARELPPCLSFPFLFFSFLKQTNNKTTINGQKYQKGVKKKKEKRKKNLRAWECRFHRHRIVWLPLSLSLLVTVGQAKQHL
ncbi:hypothetical protein TCDM_10208 [Trypanosoma cruzi Dm28c]|uniref:Uncharacterized protein n=1 Tax=Trypanosoma cruzi Dm28c TaxID=1416333 RepID=V5AN68_TRYCR|nr:hypothetical protein TCDM_10208 [Trypanosoma cruzi Dm28c]